jgi:hypothetical protein
MKAIIDCTFDAASNKTKISLSVPSNGQKYVYWFPAPCDVHVNISGHSDSIDIDSSNMNGTCFVAKFPSTSEISVNTFHNDKLIESQESGLLPNDLSILKTEEETFKAYNPIIDTPSISPKPSTANTESSASIRSLQEPECSKNILKRSRSNTGLLNSPNASTDMEQSTSTSGLLQIIVPEKISKIKPKPKKRRLSNFLHMTTLDEYLTYCRETIVAKCAHQGLVSIKAMAVDDIVAEVISLTELFDEGSNACKMLLLASKLIRFVSSS